MSADTQAPVEPDRSATDTVVHERLPGERGPGRTFLRYAGMPVFLGLVLLGLYLWVTGQPLDSIETRRLTSGILSEQIYQHVWLTVVSTAIVLLLAVPLGILVTRPRTRGLAPYIVNMGNAGQAIPSLGMLALLFFAFREIPALPSTGRVPVVAALVAYSFLPILRNTMVGLDQVDRFMLEAGKGMGMSNMQVLRRIEMPLAIPVILAGVRTALVLNVGTATLAFLFGGGGLGQTIFQGFQLRRTPILLTGAILTAVLALFIDYLAGIAEEQLTPEGLG